MRVVVVGATGNVGTAVLGELAHEPAIESIVGIARRIPQIELAKVRWVSADVGDSHLEPIFKGADAVVHLAWAIQPSRNEAALRRTNVEGSRRVFDAVVKAEVPSIVYASSVGAYSEGPKEPAVDESWPTGGIDSLFYSRHKAEVEHLLDRFEAEHGDVRVVRLRPGLIFRREAAVGIRRLFLGPLFPGSAMQPRFLPVVPQMERLRFQVVHGADVADAYRRAVVGEQSGAFNIAAAPVIDSSALARLLGARQIATSERVVRGAASLSWRLRLQPAPPGWVDMALRSPLMDVTRARAELDWQPRHDAGATLLELLRGMRDARGYPTPPLDPRSSGPARIREFASGVGARN